MIQGILAMVFPPQPEPMAEIRPGEVTTVRGTVVARDLIESPLTGEPCVYYHYTIEEWRASHLVGTAAEGFWQVIERDEAIVEFYLQDGRDRAIVAPQRAWIERGRGVAASPVDLGMMVRRGQQLLITAGDTVEVTARVDRAHDLFDADRAYRASASRLILRAPPDDVIDIRVIARARNR